jgi:hypothetical protein
MTVQDSLHSLLDYECLLFHCDEWRTKNPLRLNSPELNFKANGISVTMSYSSSVILGLFVATGTCVWRAVG